VPLPLVQDCRLGPNILFVATMVAWVHPGHATNRQIRPSASDWATAVRRVGLHALRTSRPVPTLTQVYEGNAAASTRAAEQTDDPVFRNMLLTLALQGRLAAQEEAA